MLPASNPKNKTNTDKFIQEKKALETENLALKGQNQRLSDKLKEMATEKSKYLQL